MFAMRLEPTMMEPTLRVFDVELERFLCWRRALQIPRHN
jgi:hypothetical protein